MRYSFKSSYDYKILVFKICRSAHYKAGCLDFKKSCVSFDLLWTPFDTIHTVQTVRQLSGLKAHSPLNRCSLNLFHSFFTFSVCQMISFDFSGLL